MRNRELPVDCRLLLIALGFPGFDLRPQGIQAGYTAVEALFAEYTDFDLDHVEPTAMLGGVRWYPPVINWRIPFFITG